MKKGKCNYTEFKVYVFLWCVYCSSSFEPHCNYIYIYSGMSDLMEEMRKEKNY